MIVQQTLETLRRMHLVGMANAFLAQMESAATNELSFEERFGLLVDCEMTYRQNRRLKRLLKEAHLKMAARLEDTDWRQPRGLDRSLMTSLSNCQWILAHQSVLISGPTGVGKTYLCCAPANQACRHRYSARYYQVPRLFTDIAIARGDGSYRKLMNHLAKVDLLVLDDWGLAALTMFAHRLHCRPILTPPQIEKHPMPASPVLPVTLDDLQVTNTSRPSHPKKHGFFTIISR